MAWDTRRFGDQGAPVRGLSRGLVRALGTDAISKSGQPNFDYHVQRDVIMFQRRHAMPASGVVDASTWHALGEAKTPGGSPVLDAKAKAWIRMRIVSRITPEQVVRNRFVAGQNWFLAHRNMIPYEEIRPWPHFHNGALTAADMAKGTDCSGSSEAIAENAGAGDPSGFGFNGTGNTDSMLAHARAHGLMIATSVTDPGDYIHYQGHVATVHQITLGVRYVFSFGHFPAGVYPYNYRSDIVGAQKMEVA